MIQDAISAGIKPQLKIQDFPHQVSNNSSHTTFKTTKFLQKNKVFHFTKQGQNEMCKILKKTVFNWTKTRTKLSKHTHKHMCSAPLHPQKKQMVIDNINLKIGLCHLQITTKSLFYLFLRLLCTLAKIKSNIVTQSILQSINKNIEDGKYVVVIIQEQN